jgi:hypothetical protein
MGSLMTFQRCPKRFEFTHILGLTAGDKGYRDFHRALNHVEQWLCEHVSQGELPPLERAIEELEAAWEERGPKEHWYADRYRSRALDALARLHSRLSDGARLKLGVEAVVDCGDRAVRIVVDEVEEGSPTVLRKVHFGRRAKSHLGKDSKEHTPALIAAAAGSLYPGQSTVVRISYPLLGEEFPSEATAEITRRRLIKMAELAAAAESGPYPAKWNDRTCPSCPYALVCPNQGEDIDA